MNFSFKFLVATAVLAASFAVGAQTIFSSDGYSTGKALEKPMVMKPFVEFSKARPLPELRIFTLEGEKVDLAKYRGKLLILNVWGTWCTPCVREIPQLIQLQKQLKGSDIEIVGVAVDKSVAGIPKFLARNKMSEFNTWSDPTESIEDVMPLEVVPTNFIVDGASNLVGYLPGYLPWDDKEVIPFLKKLAEKYAQPKTN